MFQYKILNNILYLNKQLFIFNKKDTKLCSYCKLQDETINHIFVECKFAIKLWSDLRHCQCSFGIPILNPQTATFRFFEIDPDLVILLNHLLLLNIYYIYLSRDSSKFSFAALLKTIKKVFVLEKKIPQEMKEKLMLLLKNWVRWCNQVTLWIKHKVKTPFKAMWGGGSKFFLHFLDFLFCYVFETNLRFIYLGPSRTLTASGIVLSVTLFSGFRKISILDVIVWTPPPFIKGGWDF